MVAEHMTVIYIDQLELAHCSGAFSRTDAGLGRSSEENNLCDRGQKNTPQMKSMIYSTL